jgi:hypothetical protein
VLEKYLTEYIPRAIKVGYERKNTDTPFVWTVGSWLIWQALKNDSDGSVERAIRDGILSWHALPFTTHTELMNETLFAYGVSLSKRLDARFGRSTVGAKMTDVPGHTIGIVPILKKNGIRFLHIGVNPATPLPKVPPIFRWKWADDEIVVMYQGDYGVAAEYDDFVVYFAHTGDNHGPQSSEAIIAEYEKIRGLYPDCEIKAATIDDLAERVCAMPSLPVIDREIGDTWIHGAGTDPLKVSRYRKLLRHIETLPEIPVDLTDSLLCVPEHTWGMDVKTHFGYDRFYTHEELQGLKTERNGIEASWQEQRNYVTLAEKALGVEPDAPPCEPDLSDYRTLTLSDEIGYEVSWQLFDNADYRRYKNDYMRDPEIGSWWKLWDFTKIGLPEYRGGIFTAKVKGAYQKGSERLYELRFEDGLAETYGLPRLYLSEKEGTVSLTWVGKKASRLPQAFWLKFKGFREDWEIQKLGAWISPDDILDSPLISGIDKAARNPSVTIESLDATLVAPFGRRLLEYRVQEKEQDLYFNLYNNIWNTNFPMWYSDDAVFRFRLTPNAETEGQK